MALELSQFSISRVALEVRYDFATMLWDRAGIVAAEIKKKHFPKMEIKQVEPNNQALRLTPALQLSIQSEKSFFISRGSDLTPLKDAASKVFPLLIDRLELSDFTRVGLRIFFHRSFSTKKECADFIVENVPMFQRTGKFFNIETSPTDPALSLRWEGATTGCLVNLNVAETKLTIDIPFEFQTELPTSITNTVVNLDADYYAHGLTATSKFNAAALIDSWTHLIRRDMGAFINGRTTS